MALFDPRLEFIQIQARSRARRLLSTAVEADSAGRFGVDVAGPEPFVRVLLHYEGSLAEARDAGLGVTSVVATAKTDAFTGAAPGLGWGAGKLDIHAAWQRVKAAKGV